MSSNKPLDIDKLALMIAEKVREVATRQGNVPFWSGDLRKHTLAYAAGKGQAAVGSNLPYARAVHDGRPAITIRPKNKKALFWKKKSRGGKTYPGAKHPVRKVFQPARKGKPYIRNAIREVAKDMSFIEPYVGAWAKSEIERMIRLQF